MIILYLFLIIFIILFFRKSGFTNDFKTVNQVEKDMLINEEFFTEKFTGINRHSRVLKKKRIEKYDYLLDLRGRNFYLLCTNFYVNIYH